MAQTLTQVYAANPLTSMQATDILYAVRGGVSAGFLFSTLTAAVGNVTGPVSSTDNAVARFDGTTGKIIQNSLVTIDDSGNMAGLNSLAVANLTLSSSTIISSNGLTLTISGAPEIGGVLNVNNGNDIGRIRLFNAIGNHYSGLKSGAVSADTEWSLPSTDSTGTQALVSNGAGVLSWASVGSGTVTSITAGSNLTGGTITGSGTIALSATPNGLTSLGVGNLSLSGDAIVGSGTIVTIAAITSASAVNLSPNNSFVSLTDFGNTVATPLRFYNAAGTHYVGFKTTTALATDTNWIWPTVDAKGLMGSDGSGNFSLRTLTNGQLFIGSTGNVATAATLTAGTGISISNASGSITISSSGAGMAFVNQTSSSVTMAANTTYFINNGASLVTLTLPATFSAGDVFRVIGFSSGGWKIAQNASQLIQVGASTSTTGTSGFISSTAPSDGTEIVGSIANTTLITCVASEGNITVN